MKHVLERARIEAERDSANSLKAASSSSSPSEPEESVGPLDGNDDENTPIAQLLNEEQILQWAQQGSDPNLLQRASREEDGEEQTDGLHGGKKKDVVRIVDVNEEKAAVSLHVPGLGVRPFLFNSVFDGSSSQDKVYQNTLLDTVSAVLNGYNACILCYGQTGKRQ